ncbi:inositol monophosphatase [Fulvimarina endophytica]|uniref:Inositol monophosphatase n=1 Tax=Fulvimarina endophytica TaxID=2293836 RepID=A0A371XAI6_9HYPH|nr:inositol monophosphatase [Fulvimarina endophytica]RFC66253.1 inositol monophosphatase [Fulvimarina endophytica]
MADNSIALDRLTEILVEAGIQKVMPSFRNLEDGDVRQKTSAIDLVTKADEEAERFIQAQIEKEAAYALFVGEEVCEKNRGLLDKIADADLAVIVDPIDGTANFAAGVPLFSIMAAVTRKGETICAAIHDPISGDTIRAEKGAGAEWLMGNGESRRAKVAWPVPLEEAVGIVSTTHFEPKQRTALLRRLDQLKVVSNYRNAGTEYRMLATGAAHVTAYAKVMPWDHAPGALIVTEAGGRVAFSDGETYRPSRRHGTLIGACSERTFQSATSKLFGVQKDDH